MLFISSLYVYIDLFIFSSRFLVHFVFYRITNWRTWLSCNRVLLLTRTPDIKSKHKFYNGKRTWNVCIVSNSVCVATWHPYKVANCQIPRYVEFSMVFRSLTCRVAIETEQVWSSSRNSNSSSSICISSKLVHFFRREFSLKEDRLKELWLCWNRSELVVRRFSTIIMWLVDSPKTCNEISANILSLNQILNS